MKFRLKNIDLWCDKLPNLSGLPLEKQGGESNYII